MTHRGSIFSFHTCRRDIYVDVYIGLWRSSENALGSSRIDINIGGGIAGIIASFGNYYYGGIAFAIEAIISFIVVVISIIVVIIIIF